MADKTGIQWTDATWNPVRGCSVVSAGCKNCYAMRQAARFAGPGKPYEGLVSVRSKASGGRYSNPRAAGEWTAPRWTGDIKLVPESLDQPLRWRKPRLVFVNSMSDLFHERVPFEFIAAVFGVMAACPQHTFQVLTKRPERALEFFEWLPGHMRGPRKIPDWAPKKLVLKLSFAPTVEWPLPNVWLGVSVEDQAAADARIPLLLQCPAAVRWISAEPLLGKIDLTNDAGFHGDYNWLTGEWYDWGDGTPAPRPDRECIDWVVVGGESGPAARPCAMNWIEDVVEQCQQAQVPVFVKQLGAYVVDEGRRDLKGNWAWRAGLQHRKGGDPAEWPERLRVRQWPMPERGGGDDG